MRVITGSARGHRLFTLEGRNTRPTTGRIKEAMMSAIQFEIPGARVLDLYAGTGQLGIETLSRGAESGVFVELSPDAEHVILENLKHTRLADKASVYRSDVEQWLKQAPGVFDLVFIDPPYDQDILPKILPLVEPLMAENGIIICESGTEDELPETVGRFATVKTYGYGKRKVTLYRPIP